MDDRPPDVHRLLDRMDREDRECPGRFGGFLFTSEIRALLGVPAPAATNLLAQPEPVPEGWSDVSPLLEIRSYGDPLQCRAFWDHGAHDFGSGLHCRGRGPQLSQWDDDDGERAS